MAYSIYVFKSGTRIRHEQSKDANFFDSEKDLEPFTSENRAQLRERLASYGFTESPVDKTRREFFHPKNTLSALLTDKGLYFRAALNQESVFDVSMIASELTDTGEFAKFDPQEGEWEVFQGLAD